MTEEIIGLFFWGSVVSIFGIWKWVGYRRDKKEEQAYLAKKALLDKRGIWVGARIDSFEPLMMRVNDVQQLKITFSAELDDGSEISANQNKFVEPLYAVHIQPGAKATLHYDPVDSSNFRLYLGYEDCSMNETAEMIRQQQASQDALNIYGLVGSAIITSFKQSEIDLNNEGTMVWLSVTVTPSVPSKSPGLSFEAEFAAAVSYSRIENYHSGKTIWVRYDPESQEVALDHIRQNGTTSTSDSEYTNI